MTFKIGDTVKRVMDEHGGMKVGDIGTVTYVEYDEMRLAEYGTSLHHQPNFELVPSGHVRTVTRKEIVPGTYGIVQVGEVAYGGLLAFISSSCLYTPEQLRDASRVLAELADALAA